MFQEVRKMTYAISKNFGGSLRPNSPIPLQGGRTWVKSPPFAISLFPQKGVGLIESPNLSQIFLLLVIHREQGANFSSFPWLAFGK